MFCIILVEESWRGVILELRLMDGSIMIVKEKSGGVKPNGMNQNVTMKQGGQE